MKLSQLKGKLRVNSTYTTNINGMELVFPLKSLGLNFQDEIEREFPYPEAPTKPNKVQKQFAPDLNDPKYLEEKKKIDMIRTYAVVIKALDGHILVNGEQLEFESDDIMERIDALIETEIPIGIFGEIVQKIQEISGIKPDEFRKSI